MKSNEELLYTSWILEQIDHSKTIVEKDRLERESSYAKDMIEHVLSDRFETLVEAVDTLVERLHDAYEV